MATHDHGQQMDAFRRVCRRTLQIALAMLLLGAGLAQGQTRPPERLRLGMAGLEPGMGGVWVAQEAGFFRQQGLDVEIVTFGGGTEGVQALVAGQLALMVAGGPAAISAILGGAEIRLVGEIMGTIPFVLLGAAETGGAAELRGKTIAIGRFGGAYDYAARLAVRRLGLDPTRDVSLMQIGGPTTARLAALRSKAAAAAAVSAVEARAARSLGFRELVNMGELGLAFPYEEIMASTTLIREQPEMIRRFLRAVALGTRRFKTEREEGIRVIGKYLTNADQTLMAEFFDTHAGLIRAKPFVAPEGIQAVLDEMASTNPRARTAKAADFLDMRFVRELDESGFLDGVFK